MKEAAKKLMKPIGILCAAVILVDILALVELGMERKEQITSSLVASETVYLMLALCLTVVLALMGLTVSVILSALPICKRLKLPRKTRHASGRRFPGLSRIDREQKKQAPGSYEDPTLAEICSRLREYAAGQLGLYYDISDIRRFVAGLGMGRLMILRGMSGTGKTSLAYVAGQFFGNASAIVPVQPMWKERSDLLGYFNEFTKRFNETPLLCKLYEAGGSEDIYIIVLDEVNISRIEYYFAEFLSLLEIPDPEKRELEVVSDVWMGDPLRLVRGKLRLPQNVWFIGTANNDDSTFAISDKVYDRAAVLDLEKKSAPFAAKPTEGAHISWTALEGRFREARQRYHLSKEGRERIEKLDEYLSRVFRISFGNRIRRQLEEYVPVMVACGGTEEGAMDDILARKILRKLEQLSPVLLRNEIPALTGVLDTLFGQAALPLCREYLDQLLRSA